LKIKLIWNGQWSLLEKMVIFQNNAIGILDFYIKLTWHEQ